MLAEGYALYAVCTKLMHPSETIWLLGENLLVVDPLTRQFASHFQLSNTLPVMTGPMIMGSHIVSIAAWFSLALITTSISHCGYHLPFLPSPEFHDFHHLKYVPALLSPPSCVLSLLTKLLLENDLRISREACAAHLLADQNAIRAIKQSFGLTRFLLTSHPTASHLADFCASPSADLETSKAQTHS